MRAAGRSGSIFANGHGSLRDDNAALHTLHHPGGGTFVVRADGVLRAKRS